MLSLSARRAWIEIKSSVSFGESTIMSLSARRAWIEIVRYQRFTVSDTVALRKESVD